MKKLIYILCFTFIVFGCTNDNNTTEEETEQVNPDDLDGDGVTNQQEVVDNTNPNDPCSFNLGSQFYPSVSNNWKSLDCDGDGVTNWNELDPDGDGSVGSNGTNPISGCSVNLEQQTIPPSDEWLASNCDSDPFSNGQELEDGTDLFDSCDFLIGNQDLQPSNSWLESDCDNDGRTNGREIDDSTDPLDPEDFDGAGSILKEIYFGTKNNYEQKHTFINGVLYDKIERADGSLITDFEYDAQNRLISVLIDDDEDITISFTYLGNQISQVTRVQGSEVYSLNVEYDGNIIYTYDGTELPDLYTQKFTFNSENKLISKEQFFLNGTRNSIETYQYDENFENLLSSELVTRGYNNETGEFFELNFGEGYYVNSISYSYNQSEVVNPFYDVYQNISMNIILSSVYFDNVEIHSRTFFPYLGCLSTQFLNQYQFSYETEDISDNYAIAFGANNLQLNNLPSNIYIANFETFDYEVHYE
jgi:hypothetical protein